MWSTRSDEAATWAPPSLPLDVIAACFIGGASASGGVGTVVGAIIGVRTRGMLMVVKRLGADVTVTWPAAPSAGASRVDR